MEIRITRKAEAITQSTIRKALKRRKKASWKLKGKKGRREEIDLAILDVTSRKFSKKKSPKRVGDNPLGIEMKKRDRWWELHFAPFDVEQRVDSRRTITMTLGFGDMEKLLKTIDKGEARLPKLIFFDTNETMAEFARRRLGFLTEETHPQTETPFFNITISPGESFKIEFPREKPSVFNVWGTLENLQQRRGEFQEITRRLDPRFKEEVASLPEK